MELDGAPASSNGRRKAIEEGDKEDLPPTKKVKTDVTKPRSRPPGAAQQPKCPDFLVGNLEDFYRPYPSFRQPSEIGFFSFDAKGEMTIDRSGIRYYSQPSRLGLDLKVGYAEFKPKLNQTPDLGNILTWISNKWECFLPKFRNQKSIDEIPSLARESVSMLTTSTPPVVKDSASKSTTRPDNLLTDFVCWRGLMTKLLCTPYNKSEPWRFVAQRHNGTIYMRELETKEKRDRESNMSPREKQMCYWGLKFEDYTTRKDHPTLSSVRAPPPSPADRRGTVNPLESFCSVVRTRLNNHSLVMAGEVDCCEHNSKERPPHNYVELKTSRFIYTDRNKLSFKKNKLMKWWGQSFLLGVPKIVCGFRDDNGTVNSLHSFRTIDIPRECQNDLSLWQAPVCLNFLDELLTWVKSTVAEDSENVQYLIEWNTPYSHISASRQQATPDTTVLMDWFINKQDTPSSIPPSVHNSISSPLSTSSSPFNL